jgi:hypothetical protein
MDDTYGLYEDPYDTSPQEKAAALAQALRMRQGVAPASAPPLVAADPGQASALAQALRARGAAPVPTDSGAYGLFSEGDDGAAQQKAAAMNQAMRGQRAAGNLGLLTGDAVLSRFGQAQLQGAGQQEGMLAEAGQQRSGNTLKQALAQEAARRAQALAEKAMGQHLADRANSNDQRAMDRGSREKAAAITAGDKATQQQLENESGLRKEIQGNKVIQEYQMAGVAREKVRLAAADPSAAGDLALIFGYMKTLDPASAVREGEFANAQNAAGIPERVLNIYNRAIHGERLSPAQRDEFVRSANNQYEALRARAEQMIGGYQKIAADTGMAPERAIVPGTIAPPTSLDESPPPARTTPAESMPTDASGRPTLDGGTPTKTPKPTPGATAKPLNDGTPFQFIKPKSPKAGGVYMFNPKGNAFWVPDSNADKARARGWKDVP